MQKKYLWNQYGLRVQYVKSREGRQLNWLFLPGGPGLGSESLSQLTESLNLPGTLWHIDRPGDGSNRSENNIESFKKWPLALEEVVDAFENVILVCHSSGGMYALSLPSLEEKLMGFVLLDSAPDSSWQLCLEKMIKARPLAELEKLDEIYKKNPSDDILKKLTVAAAPYFFSDESLPRGKALLESLPFNHETCDWSEVHFDAAYKAAWIPSKVFTLILAGSEDALTPLSLFKAAAEFQRSTILLREIPHAGHFPWIENPNEVAKAFNEFLYLHPLLR